jgi:D-glycero-alpha-D-manno-heptose-7-phosphate kinase
MIYRSKAPLRIGLAGGGTDVSPYCDIYGGAILNATISLYAYATIEPLPAPQVIIEALDRNESVSYDLSDELPIDGTLDLATGVYNHLVRKYGPMPSGFKLTTVVDAPAGSGLGSSSTLMVAIIGVFAEWLNLPLGEYDTAQMAYDIERVELAMAGGKQDQYAATFGGVNFMEFYNGNKVIVNPLRIKPEYLYELENNLLLYFTATSRLSSTIIEAQKKNVEEKDQK